VAGRSLIVVLVAGALTVGAAAFAVGRGIASDSGGSPTAAPTASSTPQAASGTPVVIKDFSFAPETVTIKAGSAVTWTNNDSVDHSIKSANGTFDSQDLPQGQGFTATFATPGTYAYICGIHNSMTGTVVVEA
jgi:plastocyanin